MNEKALQTSGIVGSVLAALCCFTPVLVVLLTGVGLASAIGYLDLVILPTLAIFAGITVYALWRRMRNNKNAIMNTTLPGTSMSDCCDTA